MGNYTTSRPIGSTDRRCPVDDEALRARLYAEGSARRDSRKEADVQERVATLGLPCGALSCCNLGVFIF